MKVRFALICLVALVMLALFGMGHSDIESHRSCQICGMDRKAFGYSRMLILYKDGTEKGTCSLHCAIQAMVGQKDRPVQTLQVADHDTRELLPAEQAVWVIGGSKQGVMTGLPKWAFGTDKAARAFVDAYGGKLATWDQALAMARRELEP